MNAVGRVSSKLRRTRSHENNKVDGRENKFIKFLFLWKSDNHGVITYHVCRLHSFIHSNRVPISMLPVDVLKQEIWYIYIYILSAIAGTLES